MRPHSSTSTAVETRNNPIPHHKLANGVVRPVGPRAEAAANRYPDRLQHLLQIDPRDPEVDSVVGLLRAAPHARALRTCVAIPSEREAFAAGKFRPAFAAAAKHGFPLFVLAIGCAPLLRPYLEEFTDATIILDHGGMPATPAEFDDVLALARYKNLALKWSRAYFSFPTTAYPYPEWDPFLKAALDGSARNDDVGQRFHRDARQVHLGGAVLPAQYEGAIGYGSGVDPRSDRRTL